MHIPVSPDNPMAFYVISKQTAQVCFLLLSIRRIFQLVKLHLNGRITLQLFRVSPHLNNFIFHLSFKVFIEYCMRKGIVRSIQEIRKLQHRNALGNVQGDWILVAVCLFWSQNLLKWVYSIWIYGSSQKLHSNTTAEQSIAKRDSEVKETQNTDLEQKPVEEDHNWVP